jgi:hypothetical protein
MIVEQKIRELECDLNVKKSEQTAIETEVMLISTKKANRKSNYISK